MGRYSGTLGFGLSDNFHLGGCILGHSDLDSLTIWGGTLTLGFGLLTIFIGGYSGTLGFGLSDNFHFGGDILGHSDLDSLTIFICTKLLQNRGILWDLDQNFNHSSSLMHHR